jgi:DNA-binding transcriptional MerR regulator
MRERLHIGEVARLVGVSTKTIRYYHEIGLLAEPERTPSGYRLYSARHLLRLQRIRHLRTFGLSLDRIHTILGVSSQADEDVLRTALHALVEELSESIVELEERRTFLLQLLASERLAPPTEEHLFSSPATRAQFASQLTPDALAWGQHIDAMLGSFHWPAEYRQLFQSAAQQIAAHSERYHHLFTLEERFAALAHLPANAPEVEQLAEAYINSPELPLLRDQLAHFAFQEHGPLSSTLMELMAETISPAQQRFFEILAQRASFSGPT